MTLYVSLLMPIFVITQGYLALHKAGKFDDDLESKGSEIFVTIYTLLIPLI